MPCAVPTCPGLVKEDQLLCHRHWNVLSEFQRHELSRAWRWRHAKGGTRRYLKVRDESIAAAAKARPVTDPNAPPPPPARCGKTAAANDEQPGLFPGEGA